MIGPLDEAATDALCYEAQISNLRYRLHVGERMLERSQPSRVDILFILCDDDPQIVEPYSDDPRGRSCLIWGIIDNGRVGHIVCSYPPNPWVITTYWPDTEPEKWSSDFKWRVQRQTQ